MEQFCLWACSPTRKTVFADPRPEQLPRSDGQVNASSVSTGGSQTSGQWAPSGLLWPGRENKTGMYLKLK